MSNTGQSRECVEQDNPCIFTSDEIIAGTNKFVTTKFTMEEEGIGYSMPETIKSKNKNTVDYILRPSAISLLNESIYAKQVYRIQISEHTRLPEPITHEYKVHELLTSKIPAIVIQLVDPKALSITSNDISKKIINIIIHGPYCKPSKIEEVHIAQITIYLGSLPLSVPVGSLIFVPHRNLSIASRSTQAQDISLWQYYDKIIHTLQLKPAFGTKRISKSLSNMYKSASSIKDLNVHELDIYNTYQALLKSILIEFISS